MRPSVRHHFSPKPRYKFFCLFAWSCTFIKHKKVTISFFWRKFKIGPFLAKNGQNWPFLAKNACFGLFLPNATINVPHFCHRNIFFGVLKNGAKFFGGKILKFDFLGIFLTKIWPFWTKYAHFGLFLPNGTTGWPAILEYTGNTGIYWKNKFILEYAWKHYFL